MRSPLGGWPISFAAAAVCAIFVLSARAQSPVYKAPRTADGKPNLNGIWQAVNTANWDLQGHTAQASHILSLGAQGAEPGGVGVVEGGEIPYLREAFAQKQKNYANRFQDDPEIKCYQPGVPRATYLPFPFQIVQSKGVILISYEFANATRTIYMENAPDSPTDYWMGHSVGHWEGDTLVVSVTNLDDRTWFDRAGDYHSDALHVTERYTPISPDAMNYEATIEDPKVFSRPWKISLPLYKHLEKNARLMEFRCVEFVEDLIYGPYYKHPVVAN
ncbi:MAG TPA: hypothetical protein VEV17_11235 [Bryobacteraceae bacterium]|nr:hypothetical protein [Bryobacteraceae bacterium]